MDELGELTRKFVDLIMEKLPKVPPSVMEDWLPKPARLERVLRLALDPTKGGYVYPVGRTVKSFDEARGAIVTRLIGTNVIVQYEQVGGSRRIRVGQSVHANGRFGPPAGTWGIVTGISEPDPQSLADYVVIVRFEDEPDLIKVTLKDLFL